MECTSRKFNSETKKKQPFSSVLNCNQHIVALLVSWIGLFSSFSNTLSSIRSWCEQFSEASATGQQEKCIVWQRCEIEFLIWHRNDCQCHTKHVQFHTKSKESQLHKPRQKWAEWPGLVRARNKRIRLKHRAGLTVHRHVKRNVPVRWEENVRATLLSSSGFAYWSSSASTQKQPSDISWGRIWKHKFTIQHSDPTRFRMSVIWCDQDRCRVTYVNRRSNEQMEGWQCQDAWLLTDGSHDV